MNYDIKNINLSTAGRLRIDWAEREMPVLRLIRQRFKKEKPLKGVKLGACLHVTAETANLMRTLKDGGAETYLCASNPLSTQDDVAASLVRDFGIPVFAIKGEDGKTYFKHINAILDAHPQITMDDGADLVAELHKNRKLQLKEIIGSSEETTTGVIRLKAMEKDNALKLPVLAVNDSDTKHLFDNRFGTGQSTLDGLLRATNILLAGKVFAVCGFGFCGRGLADRARGMGARVVVCETDSIKALEAVMMGFEVMRIEDAIAVSDIMITVTGDKHVIDEKHFINAKDGIIIANSGHFNVEINLDALEQIAVSKRRVREFVDEYLIPVLGSRFSVIRSKSIGFQLTSLETDKLKTDKLISENRKPKTDNRDFKRIYILGEGRLLNLSCAEGHPASVMDMSFANQALAAEWLLKNKNKLTPKVYRLPIEMDREIAELKLKAMGMKHDELSAEQKKYLSSWKEGT
jgi:adenosylhomocysteinase